MQNNAKNCNTSELFFRESKQRRCTVISIKCWRFYFVCYGIYPQLWRKSACNFLSVSFIFVYFLAQSWGIPRPKGSGDRPVEDLNVVILQTFSQRVTVIPHTEFELFFHFKWDCSCSCIQKLYIIEELRYRS